MKSRCLRSDRAVVLCFISAINFVKLAEHPTKRQIPRYASSPVYLEVVDGLSKILVRVALHGLCGDRSHVVVHHCEFHQGEEDEHAARRHPYVDRLHVRHRRQRLLGLRVLRGWKKGRHLPSTPACEYKSINMIPVYKYSSMFKRKEKEYNF